jgi:hypothetical protein
MTRVRVSIKQSHKYAPVDLFRRVQTQLTDAQRLPRGLGMAFLRMIHDAIEEGWFDFDSLSKSWASYKRQKNWDHRKFIAQGHYKNMIELFYTKGHMTVGFKKSRVHPRTKENMGEIALALEFGTRNADGDRVIPPRPLWRKTINKFFATIEPDIHKEIKKLLKNERI